MRRILGSPGFVQTAQVTVGVLGVACFVLIPAISFPGACLAVVIFVAAVRVRRSPGPPHARLCDAGQLDPCAGSAPAALPLPALQRVAYSQDNYVGTMVAVTAHLILSVVLGVILAGEQDCWQVLGSGACPLPLPGAAASRMHGLLSQQCLGPG